MMAVQNLEQPVQQVDYTIFLRYFYYEKTRRDGIDPLPRIGSYEW